MQTFNGILRLARIDPSGVRLLRHHDQRWGESESPYSLWRADDGRFEDYQRLQRYKRFAVGDLLASFVVTPAPERATLFAGLYRVEGLTVASQGTIDPLGHYDAGGHYQYNTVRDKRLDDYIGRLVIDWGRAPRTWAQRAATNAKPVLEIRSARGADPSGR